MAGAAERGVIKPCILFVDDEQSVLDGLENQLRKQRSVWDMHFATSGQAALGICERGGVHLVVTDAKMPTMDGFALIGALASREQTRTIPVILLTGVKDGDARAQALEYGAVEILQKPVDATELMMRLCNVLRLQQATSDLQGKNAELHAANHDLERNNAKLVSLQHELERRNESLTKLATIDPLTGLMNRRAADPLLLMETERVARHKQSLSVIMIDVDHFKQINDNHGHLVGDEVLRKVAAVLKKQIRPYDLAVRWGGDEVLVVCPHTKLHEALMMAERLRRALCAVEVRPGEHLTVSMGCGSAICGHEQAPDALIENADRALLEAKGAGRDCIRTATPQ
jgi:diguanylate cyclase (GGDEF)-like protein